MHLSTRLRNLLSCSRLATEFCFFFLVTTIVDMDELFFFFVLFFCFLFV